MSHKNSGYLKGGIQDYNNGQPCMPDHACPDANELQNIRKPMHSGYSYLSDSVKVDGAKAMLEQLLCRVNLYCYRANTELFLKELMLDVV